MRQKCSRRRVLTLAAASAAGALVKIEGSALGRPILYFMSSAIRVNVNGGATTAMVMGTDQPALVSPGRTRTTAKGLGLFFANHDMRNQFAMMLKSVQSGRGRMTIELDDRGKRIETLWLDMA
jgi:hypothetical protein